MILHNELEFKKEIESLVLPHSSIGSHGVNIEGDDIVFDQIGTILKKGLMNNHPSGMIGNIAFYGETDDWGYKEIYNYNYRCLDSSRYIVNIIVAVPEMLVTSNGDNYLVCFGDAADYRNKSGLQNYNQDALSNWLNIYLSAKRMLPKEFIVGVMIVDKETGKHMFEDNPTYYGNMPISEQMKFSDQLINDLLPTKCSPNFMCKIADNNLIFLQKEMNDDGNMYFKPVLNFDLSDMTKAMEELDSYIEVCTKWKINTFYLEQIKKHIERSYVK